MSDEEKKLVRGLAFTAGYACGFATTNLGREWTREDFDAACPPCTETERQPARETAAWMRKFADALDRAAGDVRS